METSLVKWTPPVQAPVRKEVLALPAPQPQPAPAAGPLVAVPRQHPGSALSTRLVRQMRDGAAPGLPHAGQPDNPDQAVKDQQARLLEARFRGAEESVHMTSKLG